MAGVVPSVSGSLLAINNAFTKNKEEAIEKIAETFGAWKATDSQGASLFAQHLATLVNTTNNVTKPTTDVKDKAKDTLKYPNTKEIIQHMYTSIVQTTQEYFAQAESNATFVDHLPLGISVLQDLSQVDIHGLATHFTNLTAVQTSLTRVDAFTRYEQGMLRYCWCL